LSSSSEISASPSSSVGEEFVELEMALGGALSGRNRGYSRVLRSDMSALTFLESRKLSSFSLNSTDARNRPMYQMANLLRDDLAASAGVDAADFAASQPNQPSTGWLRGEYGERQPRQRSFLSTHHAPPSHDSYVESVRDLRSELSVRDLGLGFHLRDYLVLFSIFVSMTATAINRKSFAALLYFFITGFDVSVVILGSIMSVEYIASVLGNMPAPTLVSRFGIERVNLFFAFTAVIGSAMCVWVDTSVSSLVVFAAGRVLVRSAPKAVSKVMLSTYFHDHPSYVTFCTARGTVLGVARVFTYAALPAIAAAVDLAVALAFVLGINVLSACLQIIPVLETCRGGSRQERINRNHKKKRARDGDAVALVMAASAGMSPTFPTGPAAMRHALGRMGTDLWLITAYDTAEISATIAMGIFALPAMIEAGVDASAAGAIFAVGGLVAIPLSPLVGVFASRYGGRLAISLLVTLLWLPAFVAFAFFPGLLSGLAISITFGGTKSVAKSLLSSTISMTVPPSLWAAAHTVISLATTLPGVYLPPSLALTRDLTGAYTVVMWVATAHAVVALSVIAVHFVWDELHSSRLNSTRNILEDLLGSALANEEMRKATTGLLELLDGSASADALATIRHVSEDLRAAKISSKRIRAELALQLGVSVDEIHGLDHRFREADRRQSGVISFYQFASLLGMGDPPLVHRLFTALDDDSSGLLDGPRFVLVSVMLRSEDPNQRLAILYTTIDSDRCGHLDGDEISEFLSELLPSSDQEECRAIVQRAMRGQDEVGIVEFTEVIKSLLSLDAVVQALLQARWAIDEDDAERRADLDILSGGTSDDFERLSACQRLLGKRRCKLAGVVFAKECNEKGQLDGADAMGRVLKRVGVDNTKLAGAMFLAADRNQSGMVLRVEFLAALTRIIAGDGRFLFEIIDADRSGRLDNEEMLSFFAALLPSVPKDLLRDWADLFMSRCDTDGDGEVSLVELLTFLRTSLESWRRIVDAVVGLIKG
jgi:Ca2+-binding EF-hand superfamily protein